MLAEFQFGRRWRDVCALIGERCEADLTVGFLNRFVLSSKVTLKLELCDYGVDN